MPSALTVRSFSGSSSATEFFDAARWKTQSTPVRSVRSSPVQNVFGDEPEARMVEHVRHVARRSRRPDEVVDARHRVVAIEQRVAQVRTDEPRPTGDDHALGSQLDQLSHAAAPYDTRRAFRPGEPLDEPRRRHRGSSRHDRRRATSARARGRHLLARARSVRRARARARDRGVDRLVELPVECDVVLAQDGLVVYDLAERYPRALSVFRICGDTFDFQSPPQVEGVVDLVVALSERYARLARACAVKAPLARLRIPVDIHRLAPVGDDPRAAPPRRHPRQLPRSHSSRSRGVGAARDRDQPGRCLAAALRHRGGARERRHRRRQEPCGGGRNGVRACRLRL